MLELSDFQRKKIRAIGKKYDLKLLLLHGSYAIGGERKDSDIDIAVLGKKSLDWRSISKIFFKLEDLFVQDLDKELDFKSLHAADPYFLYKVATNSQLLYGDKLDYYEFKAYATKVYLDSKDLRILEKKMVNKYQNYLNTNYA